MALVYLATRGIPQMFWHRNCKCAARKNVMMAKSEATSPAAGKAIVTMDLLVLRSAKQNESKISCAAYSLWRKTAGAIHQGRLIHFIPENNCYVYFRVLKYSGKKSSVMVVLNRNEKPQTLDLQRFREVLGGAQFRSRGSNAIQVASRAP